MLIALVLTLLPLPQWLAIVWPNVVLLTVLYWSTMAPAGGVLIGFAAGLTIDVLGGTQLGQHAFAFSLVTYMAIKLHLLTRSKPIFEQATVRAAGVAGVRGHAVGHRRFQQSQHRYLAALAARAVGAILWPIMVGLLGRLHSPR